MNNEEDGAFAITIRADDEDDMNDTDETSVTAMWKWLGKNKFDGTVSGRFTTERGYITLATNDPHEYAKVKRVVQEKQRLHGGTIKELCAEL